MLNLQRLKSLSKGGTWTAVLVLVACLASPAEAARPGTQPPVEEGDSLTWTMVHNSPGVYWYTMDFPTDDVGYAVGGPDWNVNGGIGSVTVAKTTDGGQTWTDIAVPNTDRFMRGLACKDASTCWISGAGSPRIQRTTNGGSSWQAGTIVNNVWTGWLWSAGWTGIGSTALVGTTGYADEPGRRANFLRTTDGLNFNAVVANSPLEFVIYDFSCPTPGHCYAAAKQSAFYTTNNGVTWGRRAVPQGRYYGIWCTDDSTCWEVGADSGGSGTGTIFIYRTTDGGATWQLADADPLTGNRTRLWNVQMVDSQHGYAVGCSNAPDYVLEICQGQGLIMRTDDGITWQPIPSPSGADIMDLHVFSMSEVLVADWSGKIWRGVGESVPNPYDVNGDGVVNLADLIETASHWGATDPALLQVYDLNHNDLVDIGDIMLIAANMT